MERFSRRESVILGCSPQSQRSFMNDHASPKAQQRNSDIDFNDVFGGPPRRFSIHETQGSFIQGTDDCAFRRDDGVVASHNSWNSLSEKPVFGEGFNPRRHTSENFFDDIFKGNECLSSSPRKRDWGPYSSPPGSQVLSPARPLPPKAEPFGTSLPEQFCLPAKMTKGVELPTFGSAPRSPNKSKDVASNGVSFYSSPLSRSSSLNHSHEERNDRRSSYCLHSILSREFSLSTKESSNLIRSTETGSEKELNSSEVMTSSNQFHFSIYKWAINGVPLVMPPKEGSSLRSRENSNTDRRLSSDGWKAKESELSTETLHDTKLSLNGVSTNAKSFVMEHDKENDITPSDTSIQDLIEMQQRVDAGNTTSQNTGEETKPHSKSEIGLHNKLEKVSVVVEEAHKPESKPLRSLISDNDYEQNNEEITKKATKKERMVKSTRKASVVPDFSKNIRKHDEKGSTLASAEIGKYSQQDSPMNSGDAGKIRSKGRVKDFIKIFNQEGFPKSKISVDPRSQSSRWSRTGSSKTGKEANFCKNGTDEKIHKSSGFEKKSSPDAPTMVNENLPHTEKQKSAIKNTNCMPNGTSELKGISSSAFPESQGNASNAILGDTDESFPENCLVIELTQDENKLPKTGKDSEDIQVIDAKLQKWSKGKDGNMRSLLSTLQYVLWPESGWKTVRLADIIEGSAVKRSYQKALLCLHPDKLQQKGATSEQKYVAEKVFDILQEAWTDFNSFGSF